MQGHLVVGVVAEKQNNHCIVVLNTFDFILTFVFIVIVSYELNNRTIFVVAVQENCYVSKLTMKEDLLFCWSSAVTKQK